LIVNQHRLSHGFRRGPQSFGPMGLRAADAKAQSFALRQSGVQESTGMSS